MKEGLSYVFKGNKVKMLRDCKNRINRVVPNTGTTIIKYFNIKIVTHCDALVHIFWKIIKPF